MAARQPQVVRQCLFTNQRPPCRPEAAQYRREEQPVAPRSATEPLNAGRQTLFETNRHAGCRTRTDELPRKSEYVCGCGRSTGADAPRHVVEGTMSAASSHVTPPKYACRLRTYRLAIHALAVEGRVLKATDRRTRATVKVNSRAARAIAQQKAAGRWRAAQFEAFAAR
jgi:hypothetical protein